VLNNAEESIDIGVEAWLSKKIFVALEYGGHLQVKSPVKGIEPPTRKLNRTGQSCGASTSGVGIYYRRVNKNGETPACASWARG
jgi:hypothetical protein